MHERSVLGDADVTDAELAAMVAELLGARSARLLSSHAESVAYDIPAITTAGRYRVHGEVAVDGRSFRAAPIPQFMLEMLAAGGLVPYARGRLTTTGRDG